MTLLTAGFFSWSALLLFLVSAACSQFSGWRLWDRSGTGAGAGWTEQSVNVRSIVLSVFCRGWDLGVMALFSIKELDTKSLHSCDVRWKLGWPSGLLGRSN